MDAYAIAANLVEEVLGGIRTVVAFLMNESEREWNTQTDIQHAEVIYL